MLVVGLTGGIGSGKSTVSALLAERGAAIVDADAIARNVVEPGQPAYGAVVARFGPGVVGPDGSLDRQALADVVFADPAARADLNAIVHPAVRAAMAEAVAAHAGSDRVVVMDIPLLAEGGGRRPEMAAVVVVDAPVEVAVGRLVGRRGMSEADARARIAAQATREQRLAIADVVVDNSGSLEDLRAEVERAWAFLLERRDRASAAG